MPDVRNETSQPTPASTKAGLDYAGPATPGRMQRASGAVRRWARDTFSREQLVAALKQLAWVAPLTVLIWVYAEREQRTTDSDVRFSLEVFSNNPKVFVRLLEPSDGYASADLTGARSQLDKLRRELGGGMNAVRFEVPADRKDGEHQFPLTFVLGRDSRFAGVTAGNALPRNITVLVDTLVEETVPVRLREGDEKLFEQVLFNPATVRVRLPESVRDDIRARSASLDRQLVAYADLSAVTDRTPGRRLELSGVPIALRNAPPGEQNGITLSPPTVSVSLTVRRADRELTVPRVTIQEMTVSAPRNDWNVRKDRDTLLDVVLVGPAEAIERLEQDPRIHRSVEAYVKIEPEDVGRPRQKEVFFRLPPGVRVKSADNRPVTADQPPTIEVTVENRTDSQ